MQLAQKYFYSPSRIGNTYDEPIIIVLWNDTVGLKIIWAWFDSDRQRLHQVVIKLPQQPINAL